VSSTDENLSKRVQAVLEMASTTVTSLSDTFVANTSSYDDEDMTLKKIHQISETDMDVTAVAAAA
jgi:hypothetical protein